MSQLKVMIATPSATRTVGIEYMSNVLQLVRELDMRGVANQFTCIGGDCFIDKARNTLLALFMESDCSHIFFIDDDVGFDVDGFLKILAADKDICAGVYPKKEDKESFHVIFDTVSIADRELISCDAVSAGFMCIKRAAIERMIEAHPELECNFGGRIIPMLFRTMFDKGEYIGEDISFCRLWRALGGYIWINPDINFSHSGRKTWRGNFQTSVLAAAQLQQQPFASPRAPSDELDGDIMNLQSLDVQSYGNITPVSKAVSSAFDGHN